jgi:hypothetical protein
MAKVPDLGSDFAQKMLLDLRRRRERLGFGSAAQQQQRTSSNAATPRGTLLSVFVLHSQLCSCLLNDHVPMMNRRY